MVRVKIGTDIREYPQGTTWAQVAEEYQSGFEHDILLVQIGGKLQELHKTVRDGSLRFITAEKKPGMSAYQRSATLLMLGDRGFLRRKGFFRRGKRRIYCGRWFFGAGKGKNGRICKSENSHPKAQHIHG